MCRERQTDNLRQREEEFSKEQKVRYAFRKGKSTCYVFVNVKFNGILESARTIKIRGFDSFSRCKSRGGGYGVSHGSTLKMTSRTHLSGV